MKLLPRYMVPVALTTLVVLGGPFRTLDAQDRANNQLPPLIDREIFFGDPELAGARLSPDGKHVSFLKTNNGQLNIWVKKREEPFSAARPLTADSKRPITGHFWTQDGKYVLYVHDSGGDENFHLYRVDPTAATATRLPPAHDLTPYGKVQTQLVAVPEKMPGQVMVALNDRDAAKHDVYRIDIETGKRELLFRNDQGFLGFTADLDGRLRLGTKVAADGLGTEVHRIEGEKATLLFTLTCDIFQGCAPLRFHKDGRRLYVTNAGAQDNLTHLALYHLETGKWEKVEEDPEGKVDFGGAEFSESTDELVATYYVGDRLRTYPKNQQFAQDLERVRKAVGDGDIYFGSATEDDRLHIVAVTSDVDPGVTYLYDRATGKVDLLYRPRPKLPLQHLAPMKPVRYSARDGLEIPAYLTVPKGVEPRNLPTVILPHGGPWGRDNWGYNSFAQFLANRGYAVLQPNFRGSTGFGRRFLDAGNKQWGTGAMQHDISDGVKWIIAQGIADPKRVAIMGGSYGGYATLAGVAFTPELYAAGVSIVGPSSIPTLLASIPPYWAPIKKSFDARLGDPSDPAELERLKAQSPLYSATRITAPLLVIQGANDPRVKKAESDQIVIALRDLDRDPEYLVAPDEGHGFAGRENRVAMFAAIEKFLAEKIGGRYQKEMPKDIAARLALLTVGVDTLKLRPATRPAGKEITFRGADLAPVTWKYKSSADVGGRKMEFTTVTTVTEQKTAGGTQWLVVEETQMPMGVVSDSVVLHAETLVPVRRIVHQGAATIEMRATGDSVIGQIQAGPQQMPIRAKITPPVFLDNGAFTVALSTLPLAPGYAAALRTFDVMKASTQEEQLSVAGEEKIAFGSAMIDTYRVTVQPADGSDAGTTYWIEKAVPHRVLRVEATLSAQMGGGKMLSELTE